MDEKPTCVLCPDDYSCLGALWRLETEGIKVPEDISLIGYDGIRRAILYSLPDEAAAMEKLKEIYPEYSEKMKKEYPDYK